MLRPDDTLLRLLKPKQWDRDCLVISPEAFQDEHQNLSFYVARLKSARGVLRQFAGYSGLRRAYFGNDAKRSDRQMWDRGFGIGAIQCQEIVALGLQFVTRNDGFQIGKDGHVEVAGGQKAFVDLAMIARALTEAEVFPVSAL